MFKKIIAVTTVALTMTVLTGCSIIMPELDEPHDGYTPPPSTTVMPDDTAGWGWEEGVHGFFNGEGNSNLEEATASGDVGAVESWWLNNTTEQPPITDNVQLVPFTANADALTWLKTQKDVDPNVQIFLTNDPAYNCAYSSPDQLIAGCYLPKYSNTIFLWWNASTTEDQRQYMLLHEYSHYIQWHDTFDLQWSMVDAKVGSGGDSLNQDMELDASCRVFNTWGYSALRATDPGRAEDCDAAGWSESWLTAKVNEAGITVQDW